MIKPDARFQISLENGLYLHGNLDDVCCIMDMHNDNIQHCTLSSQGQTDFTKLDLDIVNSISGLIMLTVLRERI